MFQTKELIVAIDAVAVYHQLLDELERPGVVVELSAEDLSRVLDVLALPIRALNNAVIANPSVLDSFTADQLDIVIRFCLPEARRFAQLRLDARRGATIQ